MLGIRSMKITFD